MRNEDDDLVKCDSCGRVLMSGLNTLQAQFEHLPAITGIVGLHQELPIPNSLRAYGVERVRRKPSLCATAECLSKALSDPAWTHRTPEQVNAEVRAEAEKISANAADEALIAEHEALTKLHNDALDDLRSLAKSEHLTGPAREIVVRYLNARDALLREEDAATMTAAGAN